MHEMKNEYATAIIVSVFGENVNLQLGNNRQIGGRKGKERRERNTKGMKGRSKRPGEEKRETEGGGWVGK